MKCCETEMKICKNNLPIKKQTIHHYCHKCHSIYYKGKLYTEDEWFFFINGNSYLADQQYDNLMNGCIHSHEKINH